MECSCNQDCPQDCRGDVCRCPSCLAVALWDHLQGQWDEPLPEPDAVVDEKKEGEAD